VRATEFRGQRVPKQSLGTRNPRPSHEGEGKSGFPCKPRRAKFSYAARRPGSRSPRKDAPMKSLHRSLALFALLLPATARADDWLTYEGKAGPGKGKHLVFLTGDEEYRSEEGLPMLAKILSQRHGFKCTVLFAVDPDGTINPNNTTSVPGIAALDSADAIL